MPTIKPVKAYAVVNAKGKILIDLIGKRRRLWASDKFRGYRCIPVTVSPLKKKGRGK